MRHLRLLTHVVEVARTGSIRRAAELLNLTPSAMNRRIQDLEAEIGTPLFERRPRGVKLTTAGEMFVRYARSQIADAERMRSQVEDLRGLRRGPIQIACSQALALDFLPREIAAYRAKFPLVQFDVKVFDHEQAMAALGDYEVDLVLVFRPPFLPNFQPLMSLRQRLVALMAADHPLSARKKIRLSECVGYPVALPERSLGGRQLLAEVLARSNLRFDIVAESNSFEFLRGMVLRDRAISFQIEIGAVESDDLVVRQIDARDVPRADLVLGHLRGRNLPVPAAKFAEQLARAMEEMRR
jgi:DNA-binding transcriptional LysR family regulator